MKLLLSSSEVSEVVSNVNIIGSKSIFFFMTLARVFGNFLLLLKSQYWSVKETDDVQIRKSLA